MARAMITGKIIRQVHTILMAAGNNDQNLQPRNELGGINKIINDHVPEIAVSAFLDTEDAFLGHILRAAAKTLEPSSNVQENRCAQHIEIQPWKPIKKRRIINRQLLHDKDNYHHQHA